MSDNAKMAAAGAVGAVVVGLFTGTLVGVVGGAIIGAAAAYFIAKKLGS